MEQHKKTLLLDMDDVTVEQTLTWVQRLYEKTGILYDREEWTEWDLAAILSPEVIKIIFDEINKEPKFFYNLPAKEGAIEGIKKLCPFYDIVFVSAGEYYSYEDKHHWIEKHLPFLPRPNLILTHRKDLIIGDVLVDDGPHNILTSPAKTKIVFDKPWNRKLKGFERVSHWHELVDKLLPST